jgi:heat shock protein HslJ
MAHSAFARYDISCLRTGSDSCSNVGACHHRIRDNEPRACLGSRAAPSGANELAGTSWKLVKLQTGDETTHVPDEGSKYTITFGANGRVTTRVDCNRASSTWKIPRAGELQFGSWSRGSAKCGPGSLHDKIVTEGANPRSYSIKDGHLFLSGMAAGGFYELEPLTNQ